VLALLLDAKIRRLSDGARSLDDAMREAYRRYSGRRGYAEEEFVAVLSEAAGEDLRGWVSRQIDRAGEVDYQEFLDWYGLRFKPPKQSEDDSSQQAEPPAAWIGAKTEVRDGRTVVVELRRGSPAYEAGLNVGDEIIAIDDFRVPPAGLEDRLKQYRPGETLSVLVSRRDKLLRIPVVAGEEPLKRWELEVDPAASDEQRRRFAAWVGS
ncbi:MAG: PDZ domain-containing protein, partial [Planctomycetota bacterium]